MKTYKKLIIPMVCLASLASVNLFADNKNGPAAGGFLLSAPDHTVGTTVVTSGPFHTDIIKEGRYYKYVFRGVEAKGATTGAPGNSEDANGGVLNLWAGVNNDISKKITFRDELEFNVSPVKTAMNSPVITYTGENIVLKFDGTGNAHAPNGYLTILGEFQKEPQTPKGVLSIKPFAVEGTQFTLGWAVQRDY